MGERRRITRNAVQCKSCGDIIESTYRHDFVTCSCGKVSVDGGHDYLRRCTELEDGYIELSETQSETQRETEAVEEEEEPVESLALLKGEDYLTICPAAPVSGGEFAEQILADLIAEGFSGNELLAEFKLRQSKVRPAVEAMLEKAREAAHGIGEYATFDDIFGTEE